MIEQVVKEMKSMPFAMIMLLGLYAGGGVLWSSQDGKAEAGDLALLKADMASLRSSIERSGLETQLRGINTDLFNLKQAVSDVRTKGRSPDPLYLSRILDLENDKAAIERKLAILR